jgi:hypothetical protein
VDWISTFAAEIAFQDVGDPFAAQYTERADELPHKMPPSPTII